MGLSKKTDIRDAQCNGKDIFTQDEKKKLNYDKITDDNVKEIAKLMLKIKTALATNKNVDKDLETEITSKIIVHDEVVNEILLFDLLTAREHLIDVNKYSAYTKEQIDAEIIKLQGEIASLELNNESLEAQRKNLEIQERIKKLSVELEKAKKSSSDDREKLNQILLGDNDVEISDPKDKTKKKKLSDISIEVGNYLGQGLFRTKNNEGQEFEPLKETKSALQWINEANEYLEEITKKIRSTPKYLLTLNRYYDDRKFNTLSNVFAANGGITTSLRRILNDIGKDHIKKLLEASDDFKNLPDNEKKELRDYVENELLSYQSLYSIWTKQPYYGGEKEFFEKTGWDATRARNDYLSYFHNFANLKPNEYPYIQIINKEKFTKLMKILFPVEDYKNKGDTSKYYRLKDNIAFDESNLLCVKPVNDKSVKGWKNLLIDGWGIDKVSDGATQKTIWMYIKETPGLPDALKKQLAAGEIPSDTSFRDIMQTWWDCVEPFIDLNTFELKNDAKGEMTFSEFSDLRRLEALRYAKTMREVLKALDLGEGMEIDKKLIDTALNQIELAGSKDGKRTVSDLKRNDGTKENHLALIKAGEIKVEDWKVIVPNLDFSTIKKYTIVENLEREIAGLQSFRTQLFGDKVDKSVKIDRLKELIKILTNLKEKDLSELKTDFDQLYNSKDTNDNKWKRSDCQNMKLIAGKIKEKLDDDIAFDAEYKDKLKVIEEVEKKIKTKVEALENGWLKIKKDENNSQSQTIEKLKNEGKNLKDIIKLFTDLQEDILLETEEENDLVAIKAVDEGKPIPAPSPTAPDFDTEALATILGITDKTKVNEDVKKKWTEITDSKKDKFHKQADIKKLIDLVANDKETFATIIKSRTDINETDKDKVWEKLFLEKDLADQIKAIMAYKIKDDSSFETELEKVKKVKDTNDKGIDWSDYGGEPTKDNKEPLIEYLYREEIGKSQKYLTGQESNGSQEPKKPFYKTLTGIITFSLLGVVVVGGILAVVFWNKLKKWWDGNGSTEGEGDVSVEEVESKQ